MKSTNFALTAALTLVITFTFSCSGGDDPDGDTTGGNPVTGGGSCSINGGTVKIGSQTWMSENLNCNVSGSVCYGNDPANCAKYGRLYNWATAMALDASCNSSSCASQVSAKHQGICPSGWHIPSDAEWDALMTAVGGSSTAGTKLKATTGWNSYSGVPAGTDTYGFSALPGGRAIFWVN